MCKSVKIRENMIFNYLLMWSLHIIFYHNVSLTDVAISYYKMIIFNQIISKMLCILKIIFHMQLRFYQ